MNEQTVKTHAVSEDRVTVSFKCTIQVQSYEPFEMMVSYGADKKGDETVASCFSRVENQVASEFNKLMTGLEQGKIKLVVSREKLKPK
ncbi:MAG: hypothetical protein AAB875_06200 [Patescibacteria group bacterium]